MVNVKRKEIVEHIGLVGVKKEIRKRKVNALILDRLIFIKKMFELDDVQLASQSVGISFSTGYIWLKRWNEEGLNGLIPKYDGGKPPKLSEEDYKILDGILEKTPNLTVDIVSDILKSEFGVVFSDRHISRILKKLNYTYTKPFMIYSKMPDDTEDQLKKNFDN
ncbi:MAG: helix-turn-helix domain-containing protein [Euryarchaeota archaeon]|nr:helix-turn-helix domain-containing protein [Euryarchaeota archaeon]